MNQNSNAVYGNHVNGTSCPQTSKEQVKNPPVFSYEFDDHSIMSVLLYDDHTIGHVRTEEDHSVWRFIMGMIESFSNKIVAQIRLSEGVGQASGPIKLILHDSVILDEVTTSILLAELAASMERHWDLRVMWKQKNRNPEFFLIKPIEPEELWDNYCHNIDNFRMTDAIWG